MTRAISIFLVFSSVSVATAHYLRRNLAEEMASMDGILESHTVDHTDIQWRSSAIQKLWKLRSNENNFDTPLLHVSVPYDDKISIFFKDEPKTATGSLKHRFAWMLILWAVMEGYIRQGTSVLDSSSGNTACAEAYFARKLGLNYCVMMSPHVSMKKQQKVRSCGGTIIYFGTELPPATNDTFYINQFKNAEKALDYFDDMDSHNDGASNIANSFMHQMKSDGHSNPRYIVHAAATGGTLTSIGRYLLRHGLNTTNLVAVDPEGSCMTDYVTTGACAQPPPRTGRHIEGIGLGHGDRVFGENYSLNRALLSGIMRVQGQASIAAMEMLENITGVAAGASSGTNFVGAMNLAQKMHENGEHGSIVTIICDGKENYLESYYNQTWLDLNGFKDMGEWREAMNQLWAQARVP